MRTCILGGFLGLLHMDVCQTRVERMCVKESCQSHLIRIYEF